MSISSFTLNAIQKAGATAFVADEKLKKEVQSYAERVNAAMVKNPYNLGNDALIESWKVLARLSRTMMGIEEELKNIHRIAVELTEDDQPSVRETPALAAPVSKKSKAKETGTAVTTVTVKAKKAAATTSNAITKALVKAKPMKAKAVGTPVQAQDLQGNSAKLMTHLQSALNTAEFTDINQSAVAKVVGIPIGSMGATIGRLVKAGRIVIGTNGSLKLAVTTAAAPSAVQAGSQQDAPVSAESAAQA